MKPTDAGILILSNGVLIAGVLGEALPPESIPIQCATICGPMVELTSVCSGGNSQENSASFLNSRRKRANENQNTGADGKEKPQRQPKNGVELGKRNFTVIVPAPTSFPPSLLVQQGTMDSPRQSKLTQIRPTIIYPVQEPPPHPPPSPPPPSSSSSSSAPPPPVATSAPTLQHPSTSTSTESDVPQDSHSMTELISESVSPTTSSHPRSSGDASNDGDEGDDGDGDNGDDDGDDHTNSSGAQPDKNEDGWTMKDGEEECVCENKSFNVARVAALCSSCIATASEQQNDMDVIMETCKFTPEQYSPEKDSIVNDIQVQAVPPKVIWGQNAAVAKAGAAMLMPNQGVQMAVAAAMSFLHLWLL
ncbi:uncharacterized protein BBA_05004 [Beauveria bassiana ARSEF 2860]|uniref:Uncharacterized protein n=1 Tax=Beauveria bassiana (strain ARSEF 2860) TaxID=655819 RepID=J5JKV1_BEAB2|nr:uncharacterized protein BBA_05004 [Beauveria bassiana ARSEF 2860]EJP66033.1 hypothetical protein BBA_05004 [Beauveria bassiana ARSEF 2860]